MQDLKILLDDPEEDYMNDRQLEAFRSVLSTRRQELLDRIKDRQSAITTLVVAPDQADMSTLEEERSLNLRLIAREQDELKQTSAALARIEDGSFGWCETSGVEIGLERLIHNPTAMRSFDAQAIIERQNRHLAAGSAY